MLKKKKNLIFHLERKALLAAERFSPFKGSDEECWVRTHVVRVGLTAQVVYIPLTDCSKLEYYGCILK